MIGIISHPLFERHLDTITHVESPDRYRAVMARLEQEDLAGILTHLAAVPASFEQLAAVHDPDHVRRILELQPTDTIVLDHGDTYAGPDSIDAARHAAGAAVLAADLVMSDRYRRVFAPLRPPGHHATTDRAMGFCIFNNAAVAADYLVTSHGIERVAIVDWDVHHGNGTEEIFAARRDVFYASTHQYPYYPGTGHADFDGVGLGKGFTLNCPLPAGTGESGYVEAFRNWIIPALNAYKPQVLIISAGFDAHRGDPLANMRLESSSFSKLTDMLGTVAVRHCAGRIISLLEGGYNTGALAESVAEHLRSLDSLD